jgi:hypothetical protein
VSARIGSDVQSRCRRCGTTWHVVIAAVDGRIAQVECAECGARHRHRPAREARRAGPAADGARARQPSGRSRPSAGAPVVEADPSRPSRPFRATDTYSVGERVVHASFGEGVVQVVKGPGKVEVLFDSGTKTLVQGRGSRSRG